MERYHVALDEFRVRVEDHAFAGVGFYNALANDGKRMKPRIVKEIRNGSRVVERFEPEVVSSHICSRQTVAYMKQMMEGVVENGSARI